MSFPVFWRVALLMVLLVAAISLVLALLLPKSFFEGWGWLSGPAAWLASAAVTARILGLPPGRTLLGAVLAGIPSALAVALGVHWLGAIVAILLLALWCALPRANRPAADL